MDDTKIQFIESMNIENGGMNNGVQYRFKFNKTEKVTGWFKDRYYTWNIRHLESYSRVEFLNGSLYKGSLMREDTAAGKSFFKADQQPIPYSELSWKTPCLIFDLSPSETVNSHQWHGEEPFHIKNTKGTEILEREEPCWEVASVNSATGQRYLWSVSHGYRDDIFILQTRINMWLNHMKKILAPFESEIRKNREFNDGRGFSKFMAYPENEHERLQDLLKSMNEFYDANPHNFKDW